MIKEDWLLDQGTGERLEKVTIFSPPLHSCTFISVTNGKRTKKNWKYILKPFVTQKIEARLWGSMYSIIGFLLSISKYDLKRLTFK